MQSCVAKWGNNYYFYIQINFLAMSFLTGEYECKLDSKGRIIFPSGLLQELPEEQRKLLVINRGLDNCLELYLESEWERRCLEVNELDEYDDDNREFKRYFYMGARNLYFDGSNRLLIPKFLLQYAGVEKDICLLAQANKIELWDAKSYELKRLNKQKEYLALAKKVMTKKRGM